MDENSNMDGSVTTLSIENTGETPRTDEMEENEREGRKGTRKGGDDGFGEPSIVSIAARLHSCDIVEGAKAELANGPSREWLHKRFRTLKNEYKDQQLIESFLEQIAQKNPVVGLAARAAEVDELRLTSQKKKEELQVCKDRTNQMIAEVNTRASRVAKCRSALEEKAKRLEHLQETMTEKVGKRSALRDESDARRQNLMNSLTVQILDENDCSGVLKQQETSILRLNEEKQRIQDKIFDSKSHAALLGDQLASIKAEMEANPLLREPSVVEKRLTKLQSMLNWYTSVNKTMSLLAGVEKYEFQGDRLALQLTSGHILLCSFDLTCSMLTGIQMNPCDVYIDDVVEEALDKADVSFAVREVRERIRNYEKLETHVHILSQSYPVKFQKGAYRITFTVAAGVEVTVDAGAEYSQPHNAISICSVNAGSDWDETELEKVKSKFSEPSVRADNLLLLANAIRNEVMSALEEK